MSAGLLLGVDGGQTSTRALLARANGDVLGAGRGGPLVHFSASGAVAKNRSAIHSAILGACSAASVRASDVVSVALGLTGVQLDAPETPIVEQIVRDLAAIPIVVVVPDYVTNLTGASGGKSGVLIIAGGGSIAYGVTGDGREALAGGYGHLLGDEGSGFDIGRRAAMAAVRASEGRAMPTALEPLIRTALGVEEMRQLMHVVYAANFAPERLAELTPLVAQAAEEGDAVARRIMRRAGHELALMTLSVVRALFVRGERPTIYLSGGVFAAGEIVTAPFRAAVARGWGPAEYSSPAYSPTIGALLLAASRSGTARVDNQWLARASATAGRLR